MQRKAIVERKTNETEIKVELLIEGKGKSNISTGIGFFDHMLICFMAHGRFDGNINVKGDTHIDFHHSVEDTGIVLGKSFKHALEDKIGIRRFGTAFVPMDESLAMVSLDISSRPYLVFDCDFNRDKIGEMDTELIQEFFQAFAFNAGITLHIKILHGHNCHHMAEAIFKAVARALKQACTIEDAIEGVLSTKGMI